MTARQLRSILVTGKCGNFFCFFSGKGNVGEYRDLGRDGGGGCDRNRIFMGSHQQNLAQDPINIKDNPDCWSQDEKCLMEDRIQLQPIQCIFLCLL